jgi:penicillin-binding protein 1A
VDTPAEKPQTCQPVSPNPRSQRSGAFSRALGRLRSLGPRRLILLAAGAVGLAGAGGLLLLFLWTRELPAFDTLKDYEPLIATRVYGSDGSEVFDFAKERRTVVPFPEIPEVMKKAVLAAEDSEFYKHQGVDYLATARCLAKGLWGRACGGSTITQQVVKTFLLSPERRVKRKVKEIVLAQRLEQNLKKDEILYLYLNQIYFGHRRYGVEEASRFYFGKSVRQVSLGEATVLAGIIQSPQRYSPMNHPDAAKARQKYVLRWMAEKGFITLQAAEVEEKKPIQVVRSVEDRPGLWYADAVRKYLDERYGADRVESDGLVVDVAMNPFLQRAAEAALEANLRAVDKRQGWRGAPQHLDEKQLATAMPLWRERLKAVKPRAGEVLVWDLGRVSSDEIEPGQEFHADVRRMARVRPLETGEIYSVLVTRVDEKEAGVDLGNAVGVMPLTECQWARKYNPTSGTAVPKRMKDVLKVGDVVLVRVLPGKVSAETMARAGQPLPVSLEQVPKVQGALVAIDPLTRSVRALVGGYDYTLSQFNRAQQAKRQPGSAFKPFVWGAAIESRRYSPATVVYDTPDLYRDPWTGKEWKPQNFERDEYDGPLLLKQALAHSKNTVSAKLVDALGVDAVIDFARRAGISSDLPRSLSLALGTGEVSPLELVNAYTTIAARGFRAEPILVLRVRDRHGNVLERNDPLLPPALSPPPPTGAPVPPTGGDPSVPSQAPSQAPPVVPVAVAGTPNATDPAPAPPTGSGSSATAGPPAATSAPHADGMGPGVAFVLQSMMREVVEYGTGAAAKALGRPAAAKTGTAQEHRDAWFVGFTPELVAGVWVGFDSHEPLGGHATGAGAALPAWLGFMQAAVGGKPAAAFQMPPGVDLVRIDTKTGLLAPEVKDDASTTLTAFLVGTAPTRSTPEPGSAPQNFFQDDH